MSPDTPTSAPILELRDLTVDFGGVRAVNSFNMAVAPGELVGLIGPNGAGKTTIFNLITNAYQATAGQILMEGKSIARVDPGPHLPPGDQPHVPEHPPVPFMTAYENVELSIHSAPHLSLFEAFVRLPRARRKERESRARAHQLLETVGLDKLAQARAGSLPYGLQRRLEIARAMAASPRILLLDEPAAGMNEDECKDLVNLIRQIHETQGYTIIMIEHHMAVVMDLCRKSRIDVMQLGANLATAGRKTDPERSAGHQGLPGGEKNGH